MTSIRKHPMARKARNSRASRSYSRKSRLSRSPYSLSPFAARVHGEDDVATTELLMLTMEENGAPDERSAHDPVVDDEGTTNELKTVSMETGVDGSGPGHGNVTKPGSSIRPEKGVDRHADARREQLMNTPICDLDAVADAYYVLTLYVPTNDAKPPEPLDLALPRNQALLQRRRKNDPRASTPAIVPHDGPIDLAILPAGLGGPSIRQALRILDVQPPRRHASSPRDALFQRALDVIGLVPRSPSSHAEIVRIVILWKDLFVLLGFVSDRVVDVVRTRGRRTRKSERDYGKVLAQPVPPRLQSHLAFPPTLYLPPLDSP